MLNLKPQTEAAFQRQVLELARLNRWMVAHFRPGLTRSGKWVTPVQADGKGFVDLVLARVKPTPRVLFRELKTDSGKLTVEQQRWLVFLRAAGADAEVWRPRDWPDIIAILGEQ